MRLPMGKRYWLLQSVKFFVLTQIFTLTIFAAAENWDYFRYGGRNIHAIAQEDSLLWVATDIGLVTINIFTNEKQFFDVRDGLPYPKITSIAFDNEGNKWFGSGDNWIYTYGNGVLKYDGINWETFNQNNTDMFQKGVWAVYVDSHNILWIGGGKVLDYMLFSYDGSSWTRHYAPINKKIYCFEEDDKGNLWIGTADGLLKYDGSNFALYDTQNSPLHSVYVQDLLYTNGKLWMAISRGVECLEDSVWTYYDNDSTSILHHNVRNIVEDNDGNIWVGTYNGIAKFNGETWVQDPSIPQKNIRQLFVDSNGDLWAGTASYDLDHGLYKKTEGGWKKHTTYTNGLHTDKLYGVCVDQDNNKWFATESGLIKYDGLNWEHFNESNTSMRYPIVLDMEVDNAGKLWAAIMANCPVGYKPYGELVFYDGTSWDSIKLSQSGLGTSYVHSFSFSPLGQLWIATNRGAACYNGQSWSTFTYENNALPHNWVYAICALENKVWFGTYLGLVRLDGNGFEVFNHENSMLPHPTVRALLHDGEKLWISTEGGIVTFDDENWESFTPENSIVPTNYAEDMQMINGDIWVATSDGAFRHTEGEWVSYKTNNSGILSNHVNGVAVDTFNNIWLSCYDVGVSIYNDNIPQSGINGDQVLLPQTSYLQQNYPNPFNSLTTINYQLSTDSYVEMAIYNISGRKITTLINEHLNAGEHKLIWDAGGLSSGIYIGRLNCGNESSSIKMLLMK